jgi:hypothetical protein
LIHEHQRIIQTIAVPVEILREIRRLHVGIGREEASENRVVQPGVHVYQPELRQMLVAALFFKEPRNSA